MIRKLSPKSIAFFGGVIFFLCSCSLYGESKKAPEEEHSQCVHSPISDKPLSEYIAPFSEQLTDKTGVYVLEQATEAMMSRAWLSERAEQSIDVQYFIFSVDNIGVIATDYLVRAAKRGVKVRVLVDDIMLDAQIDDLLMLAGHKNIEIKIYNPNINIGKNIVGKLFSLVTDFHGINQRMHNKVFLVDDKVTIVGGRNIADEYFGFDHTYNFRDRDVFLVGGAVNDVSTSFEQYWQSDLSVSIEKLVGVNFSQPENEASRVNYFSQLHNYACDPQNFHPEIRNEIEDVPDTFYRLMEEGAFQLVDDVEYIFDFPGKNDGSVFLGGGSITQTKLLELTDGATQSILIQTPYLVTTKQDRAYLQSLVKRGVEIKILTNSLLSNDNFEAFSGYQRNRKALLATGVEVYEFRPDAKVRQRVMGEDMYNSLSAKPIFGLHSKTMVIDGKISVIGTYNLDPRSANLNTESVTVIHSPAITRHLTETMLLEMEPENAWLISDSFNPDHKESLSKQIKVKLRRFVPKSIL